jgi:succinate dehydrogenase/fumarate reductase flavoprotein subunit
MVVGGNIAGLAVVLITAEEGVTVVLLTEVYASTPTV